MSTPMGEFVEGSHRRVAELDAAIIELVRVRTAASAELAALRSSANRPVVELARENEVLSRYRRELGDSGASMALLLIELG